MSYADKSFGKIERYRALQDTLSGKIALLIDKLRYIHEMYEWESEEEKRCDDYLIRLLEAAFASAEKAEGYLGAVINISRGC